MHNDLPQLVTLYYRYSLTNFILLSEHSINQGSGSGGSGGHGGGIGRGGLGPGGIGKGSG